LTVVFKSDVEYIKTRRKPVTYTQAKTQLHRWTVQAIKPGLTRTRRLLELLGRPDAAIPAIQIVGTNGKGSVAALVHAALLAGGYRAGRFTSPHLEDERERIFLGPRMISRREFANGVQRLLPHLKKMHQKGAPATTFEAWTALSAVAFAQSQTQIVVLEAGMGGRLDATSVWENVIASVLTQVDLEHTRELGATLADIAREKMAIVRAGVPFFTAERRPVIRRQIARHARKVKAPFFTAGNNVQDQARILAWRRTPRGISLDLKFGKTNLRGLAVGLRGEHQTRNAALAALVVRQVSQNGFSIPEKLWRRAFEKVVWPGRLELAAKQPKIILDGAHNPAAAQVLAKEIREMFQGTYLVAGVMADKDVAGIVQALAPVAHRVWTVKPNPKRGLAAEELAEKFKALGLMAQACPTVGMALKKARQAAGRKGSIVVAGSLYLLGPARRYLIRRRIN
jgi:dihydrofolate synthase/folylpolyglutamate synthase